MPTLLTTFKGYTGHEMVDAVGLIHMGGRVYDPTLGRFLSPDSVVQDPTDLQSLNRYSYVANNPLSATDPSGHFLSGLFNAIGDALDWAKDNWRTIAAVAVTVIAPYASPTAWSAALGGFAAGMITSGGDLRAGLIGAATAAAFYGVGSGVEAMNLSRTNAAIARTVGHGLVGGISTRVQGGKFGAGLLSAMVPVAARETGVVGSVLGGLGMESDHYLGNLVGAAVIGGTASELGGGKFSNGAVTGAFSYAFASGLGSRSSGPTLSQGTGGTAFVGGFFDYWTHGPVYDQYLEYIRLNPGAGAAYFTWDQGGALASWIDANGGAVSVIGHSYGGDTAASVVAAGHGVNSLTTVDPVGWTRPSYSAVAANSGSWTNLNAVGGGWSTPNIIAGIGGAWNSGPSGYATIFRNINQDHAGVMYQCGQPGSC